MYAGKLPQAMLHLLVYTGKVCQLDHCSTFVFSINAPWVYNIVVYLLGDIFNQFAEWVLWDNNTGLYYETWTVRDKPGMFFDFICYSEKLINIWKNIIN